MSFWFNLQFEYRQCMNMQNANMNGVLDMENLDYKKLGFACGL